MFFLTSPHAGKQGVQPGIKLKVCHQGRGFSLPNTQLLFNLLDIALSLSEANKTLPLM